MSCQMGASMALRYTLLCGLFSVFAAARAFTIGHWNTSNLPEVHGNKFYYFGYGSNLLAKRIHIQNPTANSLGVGLLQNYRLDFNTFGSRWQGSPATIVPTANEHVYGRLWEIDLANLADIDDQEGVAAGMYEAISVPIVNSQNDTIIARTYVMRKQPQQPLKDYAYGEVPFERQPSRTYLQCLVKGAHETPLPIEYIAWLKTIKHNDNVVPELENYLDLKHVQLGN